MTDLVHIPARLEGMVTPPERLQHIQIQRQLGITHSTTIKPTAFNSSLPTKAISARATSILNPRFNYKRILWETGDASAPATVLVTIPQ
ncbi:hypothetical protein [Sulfuriferula sp.]|uniref:hypothetical protein n=1 Tax=Sulfuriferula sp. TaxID=2025307 RepID=UPI0027321267|nr:hypothetical protein [Sulfuriferula sp.]MDP2027423.1 hypothetical protein [Sulfuriferula sp.]